jgi:hypothetical protein
MRGTLNDAFTTLMDEPAPASFSEFRAVLYSDHGDREPFLVRKIGPFGDLPSLIDAVKGIAPRSWGDRDQALKDAIQRCRELVADIGLQSLLGITVRAGRAASWVGSRGCRAVADAGGRRHGSGDGPAPGAERAPGWARAAIGLGCTVGTFIGPVTLGHDPGRQRLGWPSASTWQGRLPSWGLVLGMRPLRVVGIPNMGGANENGGAKRGANVGRCQATSGDNQPWFPQLDGPSSHTQPHAATERMRLKSGRPAVRSRP